MPRISPQPKLWVFLILAMTIAAHSPMSTLADSDHETIDVINVRDFGARGDGETDDTQALQAAIDAALMQVGGLKKDVKYDRETYPGYAPVAVYIPRGTYLISEPIRVRLATYSWIRSLRITGEDARIRATQEMETCMHVETAGHLIIEGLWLDANKLATHGLTGHKISGRLAGMTRVHVSDAVSHGIVLQKSQGATFRNMSSRNNGGDGWNIQDCNAAIFDGCSSIQNSGNGFTISGPNFSGGCSLSGFWAEKNEGHGVKVTQDVNAIVVLRDGWLESNGKDGVRLSSVNPHLTGLNVAGQFRVDDKETVRSQWAAIRLTETAVGGYIAGCQIRGGGLYGGRVRVEGDPGMHHIAGNFRLFRARTVQPVEVDVVEQPDDAVGGGTEHNP